MAKILTAERVSRDISDNYVFQRSQLAYHEAARRISGDVLEIGTGAGYGIEIVAPHASSFLTLDKIEPAGERPPFPHVEMRQAVVPPLDLPSGSFDYVISFQVIEHIKHDMELVREVHRVLRPGGKFILTTPNIRMSLTRNPWHVREYNPDQLRNLLGSAFASVEALGVFGNERIMEYYEKKPPGRSAHHPFRRARPATPAAPVDAATPLRPAQPPQPPTPAPGQRLPDPFDHHGRLPHRTGSGRLLRPVLYRGKATQINDSGRIDIRRQSGKNHYKQQPESSSILSSFYPIQS